MTAMVEAAPDVDERECAHVLCGVTCYYVPQIPAVGPVLPVSIRDDATGRLWRRHEGQVFYHQREDRGYDLAIWHDVVVGRAGCDWPGGEWMVVFVPEPGDQLFG